MSASTLALGLPLACSVSSNRRLQLKQVRLTTSKALTMSASNEYTYLSAADPALEGFLDKDAFERSLLLNILFQPRVLVTDSAVFASHFIEQHVLQDPRRSLFEAGIASGIVVPAFRDRSSASFMNALDIVRVASLRGMLDSGEELARRLQFAAESNTSFSPIYWPQHSVGVKFAELVERSLMQSEPPPASTTDSEKAWCAVEVYQQMADRRHSRSSGNNAHTGGRGLTEG